MSDGQAVPPPADAIEAALLAYHKHPGTLFVYGKDGEVTGGKFVAAVEAAAAQAAAAERDAIIAIASELRATVPADHPKGAQASFADYLRVTRGGTDG